jgi:L-lactate dehydrogenase complex protein LldG
MGGQVLDHGGDADPLATLRQRLSNAGVVCSATPEIAGNRILAATGHPKDLADVDVAVVRAAFGIAETGSVLFTEAELLENAVAYLAQHLVVLLDFDDIVSSVQDAYRRRELHEASYAVFHTGPSATADIEGVLVHGAQGVRSLTVVLLARDGPALTS